MAPDKQLTFLWRIGTDHFAEPWISLEAFQHIPDKTAASARNQRVAVAIEEGKLRWTWSLRKPKILLHSSSLQYSNLCIQWFCNAWKSWQAIVEGPCQESIAMRSQGCADGLEPRLQEKHGVKWIVHELCWSNMFQHVLLTSRDSSHVLWKYMQISNDISVSNWNWRNCSVSSYAPIDRPASSKSASNGKYPCLFVGSADFLAMDPA